MGTAVDRLSTSTSPPSSSLTSSGSKVDLESATHGAEKEGPRRWKGRNTGFSC